jgi:hypothetical protein
MTKSPAKPAGDDMRPRQEVAKMVRSTMKAMLEMAPKPHDMVARRAKKTRAKGAKRKSTR